jgi:hypothetical protein
MKKPTLKRTLQSGEWIGLLKHQEGVKNEAA